MSVSENTAYARERCERKSLTLMSEIVSYTAVIITKLYYIFKKKVNKHFPQLMKLDADALLNHFERKFFLWKPLLLVLTGILMQVDINMDVDVFL
jgi:hypothetical protein